MPQLLSEHQRLGEILGSVDLPPGKHTKNYGKSLFLMGKTTVSMAIFNSYVSLPVDLHFWHVEVSIAGDPQ